MSNKWMLGGLPLVKTTWNLRRDGKQFVDKRRRKKREKERKKRKKERKKGKQEEGKKGEREEEAFSSIVPDLGGSRTDPTHFKR